jgi:hypothetical protein
VLVKSKLVIALGAVGAEALMGRTVILARERGRLLRWADGRRGLATTIRRRPRQSKIISGSRHATPQSKFTAEVKRISGL